MSGPHKHIIDFASVTLTVAPGEPDNPHVAKRFVLSWWEKNPPADVQWTVRAPKGWCFITKNLGVEGRLLCFKDSNDPTILREMFGNRPEWIYINATGDRA